MKWILAMLIATAHCARDFNDTSSTPSDAKLINVSFIAKFTVDDVCNNTDIYVDLICDSLRTSNPVFSYTCVTDAINGVPCTNGSCPCTHGIGLPITMSTRVSAQSKAPVPPDADAKNIDDPPRGVSNYTTFDEVPDKVADGSAVGWSLAFICIAALSYSTYRKCKKDPRGKFLPVDDPKPVKIPEVDLGA